MAQEPEATNPDIDDDELDQIDGGKKDTLPLLACD